MLLPDQTYEQCQAILTPLLAIRKILHESRFGVASDVETHNVTRPNLEKTKKSTGKFRKIDVRDDEKKDKGGIDESGLRGGTPENFMQTSEFFNNIPDYMGDPLSLFSMVADTDSTAETGNKCSTNADVLRECEEFLQTHRIRPDFFCRYRKAIE